MSGAPTFSIIVPTYDRPRQLADCLEALAHLAYPRAGFEVLVVDDGSPRSPAEIVAGFAGRLPVTLLGQDNAGPAAARNLGAERARGRFLAFTDDDCTVAGDWLERLAARLTGDGAQAVGGHTVNALEDNPYAAASQLIVDYLYQVDGENGGGRTFFTSNNLALPAAGFRALGGFDPSRFARAAGEDREFCDRWRARGGGLTYAPEAVVYHRHHLGPWSFWRQHYHYGRAARRLHRHRRGAGRSGGGFYSLRFYLGLLRYPRAVEERRGARLSSLVLLSQLAQAAGYLRQLAGPESQGRAPGGANSIAGSTPLC